MIKRVKVELGCFLYSSSNENFFYKMLQRSSFDNLIFKCEISGEPLITTALWLKQTMINDFEENRGFE